MVNEKDWLADRFEEQRPHLRSVALRMLGSPSEADDAVQESWLRLSRADPDGIENLGGWLTTVVARVSLDLLRSRSARRDGVANEDLAERPAYAAAESDPEYEALLADALGPALLVILGALSPSERLAFVLHDMFVVPFEEIGVILGRSPNAAKQLASRARRRVQGAEPAPDADLWRQREVVDAFLTASRTGNFEALLAVLDPEVVLRADEAAVQMGASQEVRRAADVAAVFCGRALGAQPALIDGSMGLVWAPGGLTKVVWEMTIARGRIVRIDMLAAADSLDELDLEILDA
jgi:RNA polymerase sigma-70 factor (ECF subfamily)